MDDKASEPGKPRNPKRAVQRLEASAERARSQWTDDPNVLSVGFGSKHRGGIPTDEAAVTFLVRRKLRTLDAIRALGSKPIPETYGGLPTDVTEVGEIRRASDMTGERDERRYDPLVGGVATSNAANNLAWFNSNGTLGTLCFKDGAAMALSNWHVWADGGDRGDDIIQPGHPRGSEHLEGLAKVAFCGPLLASLFEWEAPSPLTWSLYGGAAAAATAAALSDEIDPTRRGQEATPTDGGERTLAEEVDVELDYIHQPLTGTPYQVDVSWQYRRRTDSAIRVHEVEESRSNPHVLLFKQLWSDRSRYRPGSHVQLSARIGSSHPRSCDSYYLVAHCIPDRDPNRLLSTVLVPTSCKLVTPPQEESGAGMRCVDFSRERSGASLDQIIQRDAVRFQAPSNEPNRIVDFTADRDGELLLPVVLTAMIPPSTRVEATVFHGMDSLGLEAFYGTQNVGWATVEPPPGRVSTLVVEANAIDRLVFTKGYSECSLLRLCYEPLRPLEAAAGDEPLDSAGAFLEAGELMAAAAQPRRTCCYFGEVEIPPTEGASLWRAYLIAQTVNDVARGVPPEEAAQTIGGIIVSQNLIAAQGCGAVMAADHLFNVI